MSRTGGEPAAFARRISGGVLTIASVGVVTLWAPELVSYRAPEPEPLDASSPGA